MNEIPTKDNTISKKEKQYFSDETHIPLKVIPEVSLFSHWTDEIERENQAALKMYLSHGIFGDHYAEDEEVTARERDLPGSVGEAIARHLSGDDM